MRCNFRRSFGFLMLMPTFLFASVSETAAQIAAQQTPLQTTCGQEKADQLLQQSQAALDKKDYPQAVTFADEAAKAAPTCPVPYLQKGLALTDSQKYEEAIAALEEAFKRNYTETFRLYLGICQARYLQGKYEEAVKNCEEATRLNGNYYWAYYFLTYSQISLKNYEKALIAARRATETAFNPLATLVLKARILNELKRYAEALIDLEAALKLSPNNAEVFLLLGGTHFILKNYPKSVEYLTEAVKLNPDSFDSWLLLSSAHTGHLENWKKSEEAAAQAVRVKPDHGIARFQLGLAQLTNGNSEAAIKSFETALKYQTEEPIAALVYKGYALVGLGQTAEAEQTFALALTLKPAYKSEYVALAQIYNYRWELDKGREQLKKAIELAADDDDSAEYSSLSWNYSLSNMPQEAIIAANEAIRQDPKDYNAYANRCRAFNETKLPDVAIQDCRISLQLKADNGEVFFYLGRAYALKKDAAEENVLNRKAITLMEQRLGVSYQLQKDGKIAAVPVPPLPGRGQVSSNSPSHSYFLYMLGNAYFYDGNYEAAIGAYEKVLELRPKFPRLRFNLAASYLNLKRPDVKSADAQYAALLPLDPKMAADLKKILNGYRKTK